MGLRFQRAKGLMIVLDGRSRAGTGYIGTFHESEYPVARAAAAEVVTLASVAEFAVAWAFRPGRGLVLAKTKTPRGLNLGSTNSPQAEARATYRLHLVFLARWLQPRFDPRHYNFIANSRVWPLRRSTRMAAIRIYPGPLGRPTRFQQHIQIGDGHLAVFLSVQHKHGRGGLAEQTLRLQGEAGIEFAKSHPEFSRRKRRRAPRTSQTNIPACPGIFSATPACSNHARGRPLNDGIPGGVRVPCKRESRTSARRSSCPRRRRVCCQCQGAWPDSPARRKTCALSLHRP